MLFSNGRCIIDCLCQYVLFGEKMCTFLAPLSLSLSLSLARSLARSQIISSDCNSARSSTSTISALSIIIIIKQYVVHIKHGEAKSFTEFLAQLTCETGVCVGEREQERRTETTAGWGVNSAAKWAVTGP